MDCGFPARTKRPPKPLVARDRGGPPLKGYDMIRIRQALLGAFCLAFVGAAVWAQPVASPPAGALDIVPEAAPFATPYGAPIQLERAQALVSAAVAEARRRNWFMNVSVVDSGGNLVAFARMDGAQIGSIQVSQNKARTSVEFRRPTKAFEDALIRSGTLSVLTLDHVVASRGGIPLIENGKIIGAIGCSGGTGSQDEAVCTAAIASALK